MLTQHVRAESAADAAVQSALAKEDGKLGQGTLAFQQRTIESRDRAANRQQRSITLTFDSHGQYQWRTACKADGSDLTELFDGKHVFRVEPQPGLVSLLPLSWSTFGEAGGRNVLINSRISWDLGRGLSTLSALKVVAEDARTITVSGLNPQNRRTVATLSKEHGLLATRIVDLWSPKGSSAPPRVLVETTLSHPLFLPQPGVWIQTESTTRHFDIAGKIHTEQQDNVIYADFHKAVAFDLPIEIEKMRLSDQRIPGGRSYETGEWRIRDLDTVIWQDALESQALDRQYAKERQQAGFFWTFVGVGMVISVILLVRRPASRR